MEQIKKYFKIIFGNKKVWIYILVFLFCVKCTQNCSKSGIIRSQEAKLKYQDSLIVSQENLLIRDSIIIEKQQDKIYSLEQSLRIFDKAYDAQLKQQEDNRKQESKVNSLLEKVNEIDKNIKEQNETK